MPEEHKDIEVTPQQDTAPDTSQQKEKWRAIDRIAGGTFIAEVLWGLWWLITQVCRLIPWNPHVSTERFAQFYCGVGLGVLSVGYLTLILWPIIFKNLKQGKDSKEDNDPRWFHARILSSGIVGGSYAFLLPAVMGLEEGSINSGGAAALRQAILLATGGLIGLIALGETRRKNDNDKRKNDQEKEKNDRDHLRQVRAERRERYSKAIEQLGNEKASIRTGGVYTLTRLVDDWLEEESLSKVERFKEGQVIINNLCAYIRSPFTLAAYYGELSEDAPKEKGIYKDRKQDFYTDKAIFDSEADTRLSIIKEIHNRLQISEENPGNSWSNFEYDFSGSTFFYSIDLTNSYYAKPVNFSGSTYWAHANFSHSTYEKNATFSTPNSCSTYKDTADFSGSTYWAHANFSHSTYEEDATFSTPNSCSTYKDTADFSGSTYWAHASFSHSTYEEDATFSSCFSRSMYISTADLSNSIYQKTASFAHSFYGSSATFKNSNYSADRGLVDFHQSIYQGQADFRNSIYQDDVNFTISVYRSKAYFIQTAYEHKADFYGSIFYTDVYFGENNDNNRCSNFIKHSPEFNYRYYVTTFFGSPDNNFTVNTNESYPINLNSEGLPLDCKFLTSEQKEYLEGKFREIEKINNKLREVKDPEENTKLLDTLESFEKELYEWQEEATTVKVEDVAAEDTES